MDSSKEKKKENATGCFKQLINVLMKGLRLQYNVSYHVLMLEVIWLLSKEKGMQLVIPFAPNTTKPKVNHLYAD